MITMKKRLTNGIYVVVNPGMEPERILKQLSMIREEPLAAIQIWDNPKLPDVDKDLIADIVALFRKTKIPVLINNRLELVDELGLDGIHFDTIQPVSPEPAIKGRSLIKGITLTNDLSVIKQAEKQNFHYVSFCSLFPSETSTSCTIVSHESIRKCREITGMPIFLAGGIRPDRIDSLIGLPFNGIAVVSALMNAENPLTVVQEYQSILKKYKIISADEIEYYSE